MGDDKGVTETIAEEAKGVAVEVYKDVAKPVLAPVGSVAGGLVKLVLWPVKIALDSANTQLGKLSARVEQKLKTIPPERQIAAPATVAGPAALQYALLGDGDDVAELRELFENLLARSMDRATCSQAHPAFVHMLAQLTPEEARVLRSISRIDYAAVRVVEVTDHGEKTLGIRTALGIEIDPVRQEQYVSNLDRLGIVRIDWGEAPGHPEEVAELEDWADSLYPDRTLTMFSGTISVTPFGEQFLNTCVRHSSG